MGKKNKKPIRTKIVKASMVFEEIDIKLEERKYNKKMFVMYRMDASLIWDVCLEKYTHTNFFPKTMKDMKGEMKRIEVPAKVIYPTFEDFLENYCGCSWDEEAQAYGEWKYED